MITTAKLLKLNAHVTHYANLQKSKYAIDQELKKLRTKIINSTKEGVTELEYYKVVKSRIASCIIPQHIRPPHWQIKVLPLSIETLQTKT